MTHSPASTPTPTLNVVLVRPEYAGNVGASARAMANMGGGRLILIDPRCELGSKGRQMAAGAQQALSQAIVYSSREEFYASEGDGIRIAMTRRAGKKRKVSPLENKIQEILPALETANLYLFFGPEADGLSIEDMDFCNFACHLPVYGEFASFNLSQAVLLSLFIVRQHLRPGTMPQQTTGTPDEAVQPFYFPDRLIKEWLEAMGFEVTARRSSAYLTLKRLFLQNLPTRHELQVLEAVLQQNIRKLNESKSIHFAPEELANHLGDVAGEDI